MRSQVSISKIPVFSRWLVIVSFGGALIGLPIFLMMDPMVIFNGFFVPWIPPFEPILLVASLGLPLLLILHLIVPHLWCEKICPMGGLQLIVKDLTELIKSPDNPKIVDEGRRLFIGSTLGAATALIFPGLTDGNSVSIRPPASISNKFFNALCVRCGSCIKVCPSKILKHENRIGMGLLTPVISFDKGYCLETCNRCGDICPSGAITKFSIGAKKDLKIARVEVIADTCLLLKFKECGICKNACHYDSIGFEPYNGSSLQMKPVVNKTRCNGCGACTVICPENCFKIEAL
jgi:ferredoxin-type protein NapF